MNPVDKRHDWRQLNARVYLQELNRQVACRKKVSLEELMPTKVKHLITPLDIDYPSNELFSG